MRRSSAKFIAVIGTATVLAVLLTVATHSAHGERAQVGNLIGTLNGGVDPLALPRAHAVPVAVDLDGRIATADGTPLPQVTQLKVELAGGGLSTEGLPICPRARLAHADGHQAIDRCGDALVGSGTLGAEVLVPNQPPFSIRARLLAFNGRTADGRTAIWVHAFATSPPISLVLPFVVHRGSHSFPTALVANVPEAVGPLPRLATFHLHLFRRFSHDGARRSYISASCPVPSAFSAGFLAFARATYSFGDGRDVRVDTVRSCRASK